MDPTGLLPRANQENLGRFSVELPASGGVLTGVHPAGCNREQIPRVFVSMEAAQAWWLEEKVEGWQSLVAIMDEVESNHPQTAYAGL